MVRQVRDGLGRFFGFHASLLYWIGGWVGNVAIAVAATGYLSIFFPVLKGTMAAGAVHARCDLADGVHQSARCAARDGLRGRHAADRPAARARRGGARLVRLRSRGVPGVLERQRSLRCAGDPGDLLADLLGLRRRRERVGGRGRGAQPGARRAHRDDGWRGAGGVGVPGRVAGHQRAAAGGRHWRRPARRSRTPPRAGSGPRRRRWWPAARC